MRFSVVALLLLSSTVSGRSYGSHGRGTHSYPHSSGNSGYGYGSAQNSHSYPSSNGLSGSSKMRQTYSQQNNAAQHTYSSKTEIHHHYHYNPPPQISYGSTYHPVYQGHPPVYVYEYQNSGSRFDTLLTGLALYNLGRNSQHHHYDTDRQYSGTPGEICKLGISKRTGEYEETRIDCKLMSSFIWEGTSTQNNHRVTVQNTTTEVKVTQTSNGTGNSVTTVTKSETVVDALQAKGPSMAVTPGMTCYMIRIYRDATTMRKPVDCGLLQEYSLRSLQRNCSDSVIVHEPLLNSQKIIQFIVLVVIHKLSKMFISF